ncbi:thrombospondin type-1 domain-containing protein 7A-like [Oculina patagonica]
MVSKSFGKMLSAKITIPMLVASLVIVHPSDAWLSRRRRRRSCSPRDCQVSPWSYWSSCSAFQCTQHGTQSRSRWEESSASCGGAACTDLYETRQCYGTMSRRISLVSFSQVQSSLVSPYAHKENPTVTTTPVHCRLSSWSEWSACSTPCGISGTQSSSRHRNTTEQCGGTCTSTFRKTRACPDLSCLNGGSLKDGTCFCKEGYSGACCQKEAEKHLLAKIIVPCVVVPGVVGIIYGGYRCYLYYRDRVRKF